MIMYVAPQLMIDEDGFPYNAEKRNSSHVLETI